MKLISINDVKEYMILARHAYDNFGKVLLTKETVLTSNYIDRLKNFGVTSIYVIDGLTDEVHIEEKDQKEYEPSQTPLNNEISGDNFLRTIGLTNNFLNTVGGSINTDGTEAPFMTTHMNDSNSNPDSDPLLTRMGKSGMGSDWTGVTTKMRGGQMNPDSTFTNMGPKSGASGANWEDGSQVSGQPTAFSQAKEAYQTYRESVAASNEIKQGETIRKIAYSLLMELVSNQRILPLLMKIKIQHETLFMHSISTCVLSIMTGMGAGYDMPVLKNLGAAALLHDYGKVYLAPELLNKKEALTTEESLEIRKHVKLGHEFLQKYDGIAGIVATVALQHHERMDGSGYPNQLQGNKINHFARIVTLADVYDNLSTAQAGGNQEISTETVDYIQKMSDRMFDREFAAILLQNIRFISSKKDSGFSLKMFERS